MFEHFYNLSGNPFSKTVAVENGYSSNDLKEMQMRLDHLLRVGGIGLFCSSPGMGKTFALRSWAKGLNPNTTKMIYVCMSTISGGEFYRQLCQELGLTPAFRKVDMFHDIQNHIRYLACEKRMKVVIAIDEAQYLNASILQDLKMLTNFDMDSRDYFSLILIGQTTLAQILMRQPYEALRQRIIVNYTFEGMNEKQACDYVREMLRQAGGDPETFEQAALVSAYKASGGSIRRLNLIITAALRIGATQQLRSINAEMVLAAQDEVAIIN